MSPYLLDVRHLNVTYHTPARCIHAVRDLSFALNPGETLAIVGESGCGKTTLALSLIGLLDGSACRESGQIIFQERDMAGLSEREWKRVRGSRIGMIFQDPRNALNPVLTIGDQLLETIRAHHKISKKPAREKALQILSSVGMPEPALFMRRFPSQFSGGLCQRAGIALAICNDPELLIADEPTSSLDPTIQAQILILLEKMKQELNLALLLISHDLALVAMVAHRVAVMYGGRLVECGRAEHVFGSPAHPYTQALLKCLSTLAHHREQNPLRPIAGVPARANEDAAGCVFYDRCPMAIDECGSRTPENRTLSKDHWAACIRAEKETHAPVA